MNKCIKNFKSFCYAAIICISIVITVDAKIPHEEVYLGGMPFGVRFDAGEVVVIKTNEFPSAGDNVCPAENAGIRSSDIIKSINGKSVSSIYDVMNSIQTYSESTMDVVVERGGKEIQLKVTPMLCDTTGTKQLGVMLKDSSAGIGTITFIEDDSLTFVGLGHGICKSSDGDLLKIENGYISDVKITEICKGASGAPGELRGTISPEKCGKLISNTEVGVCGVYTAPPKGLSPKIELAPKETIKNGKASIMCTLDDNKINEYEIEISQIQYSKDAKTKNFVIKVTDDKLLSKTGGIVQGMSGSPIIQDGKLIGAVTHVLINDPTRGYGIFIENMLDIL